MKKIVLTFGLIAGVMLSVMMLATIPFMDKIGFEKGMIIGYTTMVLAFLMVYFGIRTYRDNVAGGTLSFGRAFVVGILITCIASACYVATWQFIYHQITPDFLDKYAAHEVAEAQKSGKSAAEIEKMQKDLAEYKELYKNPLINIGITFLEPLPVGLLFTLGSAFFLSRRKPGLVPV